MKTALSAVPRRVTFTVQNETLVGDLHLPGGEQRASPAVIVAGPMTSVKEQVTGVYAAELARLGIAALAIDHRHYGESTGLPRQYERWDHKVADLVAGLDFLVQQPEVAAQRVGIAAVCLDAGYAAHAALASPHVRAVGAVAGYYRDPVQMRANDAQGFDDRVEQGRIARETYEMTSEVQTIPAASLTGDAAMTSADTVDYYTRRAAVTNYTNAFAVMSREYFFPFDVQSAAPSLKIPVRMIHSENALSPPMARKFHASLAGPKELIWIASRGQTDFYDEPDLVDAAADLLANHFHQTLT